MDKGMIIRTIVLAVALLNQALVLMGWSPLPFEQEEVEHALTAVFTFIASVATWYKNQDTTGEARAGTAYMKQLKAEKKNNKK